MLAEWRILHGWSDEELKGHLESLKTRDINFGKKNESRVPSGKEWNRYYTQAVIAREKPGLPEKDGAFEKAWHAISLYQFSDPTIVLAHYDTSQPLLYRNMLLELNAMGARFLCGTRVNFVRETVNEQQSVKGFRYDTLEGHIEAGSEWFLLTKNHATGEIRFQIHASWKPAEFPTWWSKLGFHLLGARYQLAWHRLAYIRLRHLLGKSSEQLDPIPYGRKLVHEDNDPLANSDLWALRDAPSLSKTEVLTGTRPPLPEHYEKIRPTL